MTDHTCIEKICGDSIYFYDYPSRDEKPLWQLGDSTEDLESQANIWSYIVFHCDSHA